MEFEICDGLHNFVKKLHNSHILGHGLSKVHDSLILLKRKKTLSWETR